MVWDMTVSSACLRRALHPYKALVMYASLCLAFLV
jgi:hypothetical protein